MLSPANSARKKPLTADVLALLWLGFAAAVLVIYRGFTQSLTIDEAHAYHLFLNQDASVLWTKTKRTIICCPLGSHGRRSINSENRSL